MVKFSFNVFGYEFERGLKYLENGFQSAVSALETDAELARTALRDYKDSIAQGRGFIEECDEETLSPFEKERILEMNIEACEEALMELRKAFVVGLYHHWERGVRRWVGSKNGKHRKLVDEIEKKGVKVDQKLEALQHLVNTLKHDSDNWGLKLMQSWGSVLRPNAQSSINALNIGWYQAVCLTDEHVLEVIRIVSASGPVAIEK